MPTTTAVFPRWILVMKSLEDVLIFKEKGKVMLLGDFNTRLGTASEIDYRLLACLVKRHSIIMVRISFLFNRS